MPQARAKTPIPAVQKKKRPASDPKPSDTTLDAKKKAIAADAEKVREEMDRYAKLIEAAPRLKKEREKRQREEFVIRASRAEHRPQHRASLPDRRFELQTGAKLPTVPDRKRRLRAERNRGRMMFFVLLLVFAGLITWLVKTVKDNGGWPTPASQREPAAEVSPTR